MALCAALCAALAASCTVFNGKSLPADASADSSAACGCQAAAGAVFCDDFEPAPSDAWSPLGSNPPPVSDNMRAHCGQWSLHVSSPALVANGSYTTALAENRTFSAGSVKDGFFLRAWVYVPSGSKVAQGNFASIIETRQAADPYLGIAVQLASGAVAIPDWTSTPNAYTQTNAPLPTDSWTCVEWQVTFNATSGATQLWIGGGSPAATLSAINTQPSPAYGTILLGLFVDANTPQSALDVWIDDVVIDAQRVGCGS
jgi:hypothetical protein